MTSLLAITLVGLTAGSTIAVGSAVALRSGAKAVPAGASSYYGFVAASNDLAHPGCGGVLVAPDWVLTAGHCAKAGDSLTVMLPGATVPVATVHPYPGFKECYFPGKKCRLVSLVQGDASLLHLSRPVDNPAIALASSRPANGSAITVYGHAKGVRASAPAAIVSDKSMSGNICRQWDSTTMIGITGHHMEGGDSGSADVQIVNNVPVLVGVNSAKCATSDDMSAKVDASSPIGRWVQQMIAPTVPTTPPNVPPTVPVPVDGAPVASFTGARLGGERAGLSVDGRASSDGEGPIIGWTWKVAGLPDQSGAQVTYHFPDGAARTVSLTVEDSSHKTTTISRTFTFADRAPTITSVSPPDNSIVGSTTPTLSASSSDQDGDALQYSYTVNGLGVTLTSGWVSGSWTVPAHTLDPGARYTWTVQVRDADGSTSQVTTSVFNVVHLPVASDLISTPSGNGYWQVDSNGKVTPFGDAGFYGDLPSGGAHVTNIIGMTRTPDGQGYWLVASDGGVFAFGNAPFRGSMGGSHLNQPVVGMVPTRFGAGYWLVAADGGVFAFGDAQFMGNLVGQSLQGPVISMGSTIDDGGYWLAAADGGIFTFGNAQFYGSMGSGAALNYPVVDMSVTPSGNGYWMVAQDGGVFAFGDAQFYGNLVNHNIPGHIVSMERTSDGQGYWLNGCDGSVYAFGNATNLGSAPIYQCRGIYYNRLAPGWTKNPGEDFWSINGQYRALMQTDGNFVIYGPGGVSFASNTDGHPGARIVMQGDGNLVIYNGSTPIWSSHTERHNGAHAELLDNGHLVIYNNTSPLCDSNGTPKCS